jgi:hypothetical protein
MKQEVLQEGKTTNDLQEGMATNDLLPDGKI